MRMLIRPKYNQKLLTRASLYHVIEVKVEYLQKITTNENDYSAQKASVRRFHPISNPFNPKRAFSR